MCRGFMEEPAKLGLVAGRQVSIADDVSRRKKCYRDIAGEDQMNPTE